MKICLCILVAVALSGCGSKTSNVVSSLYGKKIDYLKGEQMLLADTIIEKFDISKPIKIVAYIDSLVCIDCFANYLREASKYIHYYYRDSVDYICIYRPKSTRDLQITMRNMDTIYSTVILDEKGLYLKENSLDKLEPIFTTFLLEANDRIVLIGDPLRSREIRILYDKRIRELIENGGVQRKEKKSSLFFAK